METPSVRDNVPVMHTDMTTDGQRDQSQCAGPSADVTTPDQKPLNTSLEMETQIEHQIHQTFDKSEPERESVDINQEGIGDNDTILESIETTQSASSSFTRLLDEISKVLESEDSVSEIADDQFVTALTEPTQIREAVDMDNHVIVLTSESEKSQVVIIPDLTNASAVEAKYKKDQIAIASEHKAISVDCQTASAIVSKCETDKVVIATEHKATSIDCHNVSDVPSKYELVQAAIVTDHKATSVDCPIVNAETSDKAATSTDQDATSIDCKTASATASEYEKDQATTSSEVHRATSRDLQISSSVASEYEKDQAAIATDHMATSIDCPIASSVVSESDESQTATSTDQTTTSIGCPIVSAVASEYEQDKAKNHKAISVLVESEHVCSDTVDKEIAIKDATDQCISPDSLAETDSLANLLLELGDVLKDSSQTKQAAYQETLDNLIQEVLGTDKETQKGYQETQDNITKEAQVKYQNSQTEYQETEDNLINDMHYTGQETQTVRKDMQNTIQHMRDTCTKETQLINQETPDLCQVIQAQSCIPITHFEDVFDPVDLNMCDSNGELDNDQLKSTPEDHASGLVSLTYQDTTESQENIKFNRLISLCPGPIGPENVSVSDIVNMLSDEGNGKPSIEDALSPQSENVAQPENQISKCTEPKPNEVDSFTDLLNEIATALEGAEKTSKAQETVSTIHPVVDKPEEIRMSASATCLLDEVSEELESTSNNEQSQPDTTHETDLKEVTVQPLSALSVYSVTTDTLQTTDVISTGTANLDDQFGVTLSNGTVTDLQDTSTYTPLSYTRVPDCTLAQIKLQARVCKRNGIQDSGVNDAARRHVQEQCSQKKTRTPTKHTQSPCVLTTETLIPCHVETTCEKGQEIIKREIATPPATSEEQNTENKLKRRRFIKNDVKTPSQNPKKPNTDKIIQENVKEISLENVRIKSRLRMEVVKENEELERNTAALSTQVFAENSDKTTVELKESSSGASPDHLGKLEAQNIELPLDISALTRYNYIHEKQYPTVVAPTNLRSTMIRHEQSKYKWIKKTGSSIPEASPSDLRHLLGYKEKTQQLKRRKLAHIVPSEGHKDIKKHSSLDESKYKWVNDEPSQTTGQNESNNSKSAAKSGKTAKRPKRKVILPSEHDRRVVLLGKESPEPVRTKVVSLETGDATKHVINVTTPPSKEVDRNHVIKGTAVGNSCMELALTSNGM